MIVREKTPPPRARWLTVLLGLCLAGGSLAGCDDNANSNSSPDKSSGAAGATAPTAPAAGDRRIKFKSDDGKELYTLKYRDDGAKLEAEDGREMVRLRTQENDRLKIKYKDDETAGYVGGRSPAWEVRDAEDEQVLYTLRKESDGSYRLEGTGETYQFRKAGSGVEVLDAQGKAAYVVRYDGEDMRTRLRNAAGQRLLVTREPVDPAAMACMGLDKLSLPHRVALFYKLQEEATW